MTFDPDKALIKARESVHGFYMDGPSEAGSRVEHLERVVSALFRQERKLKLERLMWKAYARAEYANKMNRFDVVLGWFSLSRRCAIKLEELKK